MLVLRPLNQVFKNNKVIISDGGDLVFEGGVTIKNKDLHVFNLYGDWREVIVLETHEHYTVVKLELIRVRVPNCMILDL